MEGTETEERKKAFEVYGSFEEWVRAHKHSCPTVQTELEISLETGEYDPVRSLEIYIGTLEDIRSEIDSEIPEARDWIEYFKR